MAILALDQGTTSSRALIFDNDGNIVCQRSKSITQYYPSLGFVEHDPLEILDTELLCAAECVKEYGEKIDAVGITNQRETVIAWDKDTGTPIYNAIVWQCRRSAGICEELISGGHEDYIHKTTGLGVDAYFSGTKMKWILDNVPKAQELANEGRLLFGTVDCWLIWNLTKNHYTDVTNASRTMLFDIQKLKWDKKICDILKLPMSSLPQVKDNCFDFGEIRKGERIPDCLVGLRICASVGDPQGAMFGQQCTNIGDVKNTYGTGCFTLMNIGEKIRLANKLVTTIAWRIKGKTVYAAEGSDFNAGSSIQWLRDELKMINTAKECDIYAERVPDSGGVVFVSAFTGLGAPYWDMYARGALLGATRGTKREHICRAVLEGIAFQVADLVNTIKTEFDCDISRLMVDGGACVSDIMMQFQADILRCAVDRPRCVESTALGAAYLAGLQAGIWTPDEISKKRVSENVFEASMLERKAEELYKRWKRAVGAVSYFSNCELNK